MLTTESSVSVSQFNSEVSLSSANDAESRRQARLLEALKVQYRADQQEKFLHLQAETDSLLEQLKALKEQKEAQLKPALV
jgi:hypothetical protein